MAKQVLGRVLILLSMSATCHAASPCFKEFQAMQKASAVADKARSDADAAQREVDYWEEAVMKADRANVDAANKSVEIADRSYQEAKGATERCHQARNWRKGECASQERKEAQALSSLNKAKAEQTKAKSTLNKDTGEARKRSEKRDAALEKQAEREKARADKAGALNKCLKRPEETQKPGPDTEKHAVHVSRDIGSAA